MGSTKKFLLRERDRVLARLRAVTAHRRAISEAHDEIREALGLSPETNHMRVLEVCADLREAVGHGQRQMRAATAAAGEGELSDDERRTMERLLEGRQGDVRAALAEAVRQLHSAWQKNGRMASILYDAREELMR